MRNFLDIIVGFLSKITNFKLDNYFVHRYSDALSLKVAEKLDFQVVYGPFKGMKLNPKSYWTRHIIANVALGSYETDVQLELQHLKTEFNRNIFIDIGGADGLYAIGVLVNNMFNKTVVFEIEEYGRKAIKNNAIYNQVEDRVIILEEANKKMLKKTITEYPDSIILMDIESMEFQLLDIEMINLIKNVPIIIEIHCFSESDKIKYQELKANLNVLFDLKVINNTKKELDSHKHIFHLTDLQKALILTERRDISAEWLVCRPKV
jgi:hypothetical protein